jgi:hypothetical protein
MNEPTLASYHRLRSQLSSRNFLWGGARLLVASVLIVAAVFKIAGIVRNDSPGLFEQLFPAGSVVFFSAVEIFLAIALLCAPASVWYWTFASLMFCGFSILHIVLLSLGEAYCECFGSVATSLFASLAIDFICLTALWISRPFSDLRELVHGLDFSRHWRVLMLFAALAFVGLFIAATPFGRSVSANLHSADVAVPGLPVFLGSFPVNTEPLVSIPVKNIGPKVVYIVGSRQNCAQIFRDLRPVKIEACQAAKVEFRIRVGKKSGLGVGRLILFTDSNTCKAVEIPYFFVCTGV